MYKTTLAVQSEKGIQSQKDIKIKINEVYNIRINH